MPEKSGRATAVEVAPAFVADGAEAGLEEVGDTWTRFGVGSARIDMTASANLGSITLNPDDGCA